jgi:hypothetical protein
VLINGARFFSANLLLAKAGSRDFQENVDIHS